MSQPPQRPPRLRRSGRDQQWLIALLPAFPLILLVLRLWYLSRLDLPTMLVLVQYVSPLGLISTFLISSVWSLPMVLLIGRWLGLLLWVSARTEADASGHRLVRLSLRIPDWVVLLAALLAALTWQMRFLPGLVTLGLAIAGLGVRDRYPANRRRVKLVCVALPLAVAAAEYLWLGPAIGQAVRLDEPLTAALLALPPALAVLLTGPVPAPAAYPVTRWGAIGLVLFVPVVAAVVFLRTPILPVVALEVRADPAQAPSAQPAAADGQDGAGGQVVTGGQVATGQQDGAGGQDGIEVLRGRVVTVDDRMTTLLDLDGRIRFVLNDQLMSRTLCPDAGRVPVSEVEVRGWPAEQTALAWLGGMRRPLPPEPPCQGRPITP